MMICHTTALPLIIMIPNKRKKPIEYRDFLLLIMVPDSGNGYKICTLSLTSVLQGCNTRIVLSCLYYNRWSICITGINLYYNKPLKRKECIANGKSKKFKIAG